MYPASSSIAEIPRRRARGWRSPEPKWTIRSVALLLVLIPAHVRSQGPDWAWATGGAGSAQDLGRSVSTDAQGNVFVAGTSTSLSITFGTQSLADPAQLTRGYVAKLAPDGSALWIREMDGPGFENATAVAADQEGNCYVVGTFTSDTLAIGDELLVDSSVANNADMFLLKYGPDGDLIWAHRAGGEYHDLASGVTTDADGSVYVTGRFNGAITTFGGAVVNSFGAGHLLIAKYDGSGNEQWVQLAGGSADDDFGRLDWEGGHLYFSGGSTSTDCAIGSIPLLPVMGSSDCILAELDPSDGVPLWGRRMGGNGSDIITALSSDGSGGIFIAGYSDGASLTFGDTTLLHATGPTYGFCVRFDEDGSVPWAFTTVGDNSQRMTGIVGYPSGGCLVIGKHNSAAMQFGTLSFTSQGQQDGILVAINEQGQTPWSRTMSGALSQAPEGLCVDPFGNAFVTGWTFSMPMSLGNLTVMNSDADSEDVFVGKLGSTVGSDEVARGPALDVFPNPVAGELHIQGRLKEAYSYRIFDGIGRPIRDGAIGNRSIVDVSGLTSGAYHLSIIDMLGTVLGHGVFVKQ